MSTSKNHPLDAIRNRYYHNEHRLVILYACFFLMSTVGMFLFFLIVPHLNTDVLGWKYQHYWMQKIKELEKRYETSQNKQDLIPFILDYVKRNPATDPRHRTADSKMRSLLLLSRAYEDAGSLKRSMNTLQQLTNFQPNDYTYQIRLAQIALKRGEKEVFERALSRTLELKPGCIDALTLQSNALYENGKYAQVLDIFDTYVNEPQFDELIVSFSSQIGGSKSKQSLRIPKFIKGVPVDGKSHQFRFALFGFDDLSSAEVNSFRIELHETGPFAALQNVCIQSDSAGYSKIYHCNIDSIQASQDRNIWTLKSLRILKPSDTISFSITIHKPISPMLAKIIAGCYRRVGLGKQLKDFIEKIQSHYHSVALISLVEDLKKSVNYGASQCF